jgi:hypothetical protein
MEAIFLTFETLFRLLLFHMVIDEKQIEQGWSYRKICTFDHSVLKIELSNFITD